MNKEKHVFKVLVFAINMLLVVVAVLVIKDRDKNRVSFTSENEIAVTPVSTEVIDMQNEISISRENNLRNLNNSPKSIKQKNITTTTTTVTPPKSNSTTKTS